MPAARASSRCRRAVTCAPPSTSRTPTSNIARTTRWSRTASRRPRTCCSPSRPTGATRRDGIRAFSLHPGAILETDLARNYDPEELKLVVERARRIGSFKTVEQGAATTIWCATSPQLEGLGGVYCENCDIAPVKTEGDDGVRPYAIDPEIAQRLWAWSERWL